MTFRYIYIKIQNIQNSCNMNTNFEDNNSDLSRANFQQTSLKATMPTYFGQQIVNEVFEVIKEKEGTCLQKISDDDCPQPMIQNDMDDMDPRLKCWNRMLKQRKAIEQRIQLYTGKRADEVLFNKHVTIDNQSKQMLLRLLDNAKRSKGYPPDHVRSVLKTRLDLETCREIRELQVTDPQLQELEFVGLPQVTQMELTGVIDPAESQFQRSQVLGERLEEHQEAIISVLNFCPDIANLQVAPGFNPTAVPVIDSLRMDEEKLDCISETSKEEDLKEVPQEAPKIISIEKPPSQNVLRINGIEYGFGNSQGLLSSNLHYCFKCDPFERMRKTIVHLENIGNKFIQVKWQQNSTTKKELIQTQTVSGEFIFDRQSFYLLPGHQRRIDVMYSPMCVGIKKESWTLNLQRSPFCGVRRINIRFHGICTEPICYRKRIEKDLQAVIDKRNLQAASRLTKLHAELAPIVDKSSLCPYERQLHERELFGAQNQGFQCTRYADLETLKELYLLIKKPRQPQWDYSIETVRQCIYHHEPDQREELQSILLEIIEPMRCNSNVNYTNLELIIEKERTCFIYVKGIICSAIEEWEVLASTLGQQFYKSELQRFLNSLEEGGKLYPKDDEIIDWHVQKMVNTSKYFKDALYIQTYTVLCDAAENIVSAIESTVHL